MLDRRWNPYVRRHSSLTEKARLLPNDYSLRLHAGWTKNSKMVDIYTHELGGESSHELLAAYGVVPKSIDGKTKILIPRECPNCREPNKPDARFCINSKCGMPLTFDAYEEQKQKEKEKEEQVKARDVTIAKLEWAVIDMQKKDEENRKQMADMQESSFISQQMFVLGLRNLPIAEFKKALWESCKDHVRPDKLKTLIDDIEEIKITKVK
jgi:hypothetical protein